MAARLSQAGSVAGILAAVSVWHQTGLPILPHRTREFQMNSRCALALLGLMLALSTPALATNTAGNCDSATAVKFLVNDTERTTSSQAYVNFAGGSRKFTQGGISNSCVIVHFSAEVQTLANGQMFLRALLDGALVAAPTGTSFIADSPVFYQTHAASFIFPSVAPGPHTVGLQYLSFDGSAVKMRRSNVIVHYTP